MATFYFYNIVKTEESGKEEILKSIKFKKNAEKFKNKYYRNDNSVRVQMDHCSTYDMPKHASLLEGLSKEDEQTIIFGKFIKTTNVQLGSDKSNELNEMFISNGFLDRINDQFKDECQDFQLVKKVINIDALNDLYKQGKIKKEFIVLSAVDCIKQFPDGTKEVLFDRIKIKR